MKTLSYLFVLFISATLFFSCNDDEGTPELTGEGTFALKFDNSVADSDLILNTTTYTNSSNNSYKVGNYKYIVSNIRLVDATGAEYTVPKAESLFVIDETDANNAGEIIVTLDNVPAQDYTAIKFGLGVDQEQYQLGASGQGAFLDTAADKGMTWSWQAGYKFLRVDGVYTAPSVTDETAFAFHMGSHGTQLDNYKEVELTFPSTAVVRTNKSPEAHIVHNIAKIFDGVNTMDIAAKDQIHVDPVNAPKIAENLQGSFMVHHVHND